MRAAITVLLGLAGVLSCTEILGISGTYEPIGVAVCVCRDEVADRLGSDPAKCQATVTDKLLGADPAVTAAWIAKYKELDCDSCAKLPACLGTAPLCGKAREGCTTNADCCAGLGCDAAGTCATCVAPESECSAGVPCCGVDYACDPSSNTCKRCSAPEGPCDDSRDCCGFGQIDVYCDKAEGETKGVCASEEGCKHRGEPCDQPSECCGSKMMIPDPAAPGSLTPAGTCDVEGANKQCVERCNPDNPDNCFGCCGSRYVRLDPAAAEFVCSGDASCSPQSCVTLSDEGGTSTDKTGCPEGTRCERSCIGLLCSNICQ